MKKILAVISRYYHKGIDISRTKEFIFTYPLIIFAGASVVLKGLIFPLIFVIWLLIIAVNTKGDGEE